MLRITHGDFDVAGNKLTWADVPQTLKDLNVAFCPACAAMVHVNYDFQQAKHVCSVCSVRLGIQAPTQFEHSDAFRKAHPQTKTKGILSVMLNDGLTEEDILNYAAKEIEQPKEEPISIGGLGQDHVVIKPRKGRPIGETEDAEDPTSFMSMAKRILFSNR